MYQKGAAMMSRLFTDHPSSVNETYLEHARFAGGFAFWLIVAGLAAAVHAVLPFAFETTASRILRRLHQRIESRRH
jgi:hypothetical protein